jgi:hypothetical protein
MIWLMNGQSLLVVTLIQECQKELLLVRIQEQLLALATGGFHANSRISKGYFQRRYENYMDFRDVVRYSISNVETIWWRECIPR